MLHAIINDPILSRALNVTSAGGLLTSIFNGFIHVIPTIAAVILWVMAASWYAVQLYESKTGKAVIAWIKNHARKRQ